MSWPINASLTQAIIQDDFYSGLVQAEVSRFYNRLVIPKPMEAITETFTSLGSPPEPHQMSGIAGGGPNQAALVKDWAVITTVNEWESTIYERKIICLSKPQAIRDKSTQMAYKAQKSMDKSLMVAMASGALGYDGVSIISTAHPESGTNQTNTSTTAAGVDFVPTGAECETALNTAMTQMMSAVDDQGTPVCEGVQKFILVCPPTMFFGFKSVLDPTLSNQSIDSSGGTGKFRGMCDIVVSRYCTSTGLIGGTLNTAYLFADPGEVPDRAIALGTLADWSFNTNVGDDSSDDWRKGIGYLRSYGAFVFFPWKWQVVQRIIFN